MEGTFLLHSTGGRGYAHTTFSCRGKAIMGRRLPDWRWLSRLSNEELSRYDIAVVNLACAVGLPGTERMDPDLCLARLDYFADRVRHYTELAMPRFRTNPEKYENSEAYFRVLCLVTVLQRHMGVRYNPDKKAEDAPFYAEDSFIFGVLQGPGGTCATLPVVYIAVGRRLGYPLKLVTAKGGPKMDHSFARWEGEDGERFNVEGSGDGMHCPPDGSYRTGRYQLSPKDEKLSGHLKSMTPRMELAGFLVERACEWRDRKQLRECVDALAWSASLVPEDRVRANTLDHRINDWTAELKALMPPAFPKLYVRYTHRRYPATLPEDVEYDIHALGASDNILKDPELNRVWWDRMRRGERRAGDPVAVHAVSHPGGCDITFELVRGAAVN